ncbi:AAA family ATPase [Streptacidiphilus sp. P02-A3a]|uniref:AAA family ATPase n=1 Tax=Streptacidiphilus sp. P02-A3a TaxID=2704468 RepID=UPI0015F7CE1C|nr:AAA family ATPase [Streptacidiphilus sp. P02-A3a]QMU72573.1 AAA family ATPase [Streptacidiphilus sp. P02-A3a]
MYIAKVKISNILGFNGSRNVDLDFARPNGKYAGWTVLAGRNGSGKTSLLRCLALASAGAEIAPRIAPSYITWGADPSSGGRVSADFYLDAHDLKAIYGDPGQLKPGINWHRSMRLPARTGVDAGARVRLNSEWHDRAPSHIRSLHGEAPSPDGPSESRVVPPSGTWFAAGYGPFRRLSPDSTDPFTTRLDEGDPRRVLENADRFATLFSEDAALNGGLSWLVGLHLRQLEGSKASGRLLAGVLDLLSDGLLPDGHEALRVNSQGLWIRHGRKSFPIRSMSDGYRAVIALVLDLVRNLDEFYGGVRVSRAGNRLTVRRPGVVLIDEIDAHLHVSWQQRIGGWLTRHFPDIQFIVSTHSPYVCQAADPGGLIRLPGPNEQSGPQVVSEAQRRRIVYGSGDDAAMSELFGLDTPYSERAEELRRELVQLERKVLRGQASKEERSRYTELSATLSSSPSARIDEVAARLGSGR